MHSPAESARPQPRLLRFPLPPPVPRPRPRPRLHGRAVVLQVFALPARGCGGSSALPATRRIVRDYHRNYRNPRARSVELAGYLNKLLVLELETKSGCGLMTTLLSDWLTTARMNVNFRRVADRLLVMFGPRTIKSPAPSLN